jgi:hypothetical protein
MYRNQPLDLDLNDMVTNITRVKVSRLTLGQDKRYPKVTFDLGADIKEAETAKGRLRLRFVLYIDSIPTTQRAELEGMLTILSSSITMVTDLKDLGDDKISEMAMEIYKKNYELLYLLFSTEGLSAPSPWLIRDVQLMPGLAKETPVQASPEPAPVPAIAAVSH